MMSRAWIGPFGVLLAIACFDGEGLRGAPCLADADCGPKLECLGPEGAGTCGGGSGGTVESRWPDSPTVLCSDGTNELGSCPEPGNPGYGQDGNYRIAVPDYQESDGIVHDSVTGLDWEPSSSVSEYPQQAAIDRCANLQLDGRTWRLPSRLELASLLDFGREHPFPGLYTGLHWTSSGAGGADEGWMVDFISWSVTVYSPNDTGFAICVTGDPLVSSFTMTSETIRDGLTGLEWQREPAGQRLPWLEALAHCEGLELADRSDWRLPSAKELVTLVRDDRQPIAGLADAGDVFWSSSPGYPFEGAVTVFMPDGITGADVTEFANHLRCVRGPD